MGGLKRGKTSAWRALPCRWRWNGSPILCFRNSRITTSREVATELWRMAKEYQAQVAELGAFPEIGDEPPLWSWGRQMVAQALATQIAIRIVTTTTTLAPSINISATS
jgi:hypothetical protein